MVFSVRGIVTLVIASLLVAINGCATNMGAGTTAAATGLTGLAVKSEADHVLDRIGGLVASLDGSIKTSIDNGTAGLRQGIADLDRLAGDKIKQPIENLGLDARQVAISLDEASKRLNEQLDQLNKDAYTNIGVFAAAVETAGLEFKSGSWFFKEGSPRIYYFAFIGNTPGVVPAEGGRFDLKGFRLWKNGAQSVELLDIDRHHIVAQLKAEPSSDENTISLVLPPEVVKQHAGEPLELRVRLGKKSELFTHMVMPRYVAVQAKVAGHIAYTCTGSKREIWDKPQELNIRNGSIEQEHSVNEPLVWNDLPQGARIIAANVTRVGDNYRSEGVQATVTGDDRIHVAGTMGHAKGELGRLNHPSYYHVLIRPVLLIALTEHKASDSTAMVASLESPNALVNTSVPVTCTAPAGQLDPGCSFWFTVQLIADGKPLGEQFESPHTPVGKNGGRSESFLFKGLTLTGQCDPRLVDGKNMQVSVEIARRR